MAENVMRPTTESSYNSLKKRELDGQVRKSTRGMPWHWEPTKDVTSCDKLRGGANSP